MELEIQFPVSEQIGAFSISGPNQPVIDYELLEHKKSARVCLSPLNLPTSLEVDCYRVRLMARGIPPCAFQCLSVVPVAEAPNLDYQGTPIVDQAIMENANLRVCIGSNGRVDLFDKRNNAAYPDIMCLEDEADVGTLYEFEGLPIPKISSARCTPLLVRLVDTPLLQKYRLGYQWQLPAEYDADLNDRSKTSVTNCVEIVMLLAKESGLLELEFSIDNRSKDHRLRVVFNAGIDTLLSFASAPFDVVGRNKIHDLGGHHNNDHPNSDFVDISDGKRGMAFLTEGVYEYNHLKNESGKLVFTLVRAVKGFGEYNDRCQDGQCIRKMTMRLALVPHTGSYRDAEIPAKALRFANKPLVVSDSLDPKTFVRGRPVVQDSSIQETFYPSDHHAGLVIPVGQSFFQMNNRNILVTAFKKAQQGKGSIIRIYNPGTEVETLALAFFSKVTSVFACTMEEECGEQIPLTGNTISIRLDAKKIRTFFWHSS